MRYIRHGSILAGFAALLLTACGGGGGTSGNPPTPPPVIPTTNIAPTANAGASQSVISGATVTLNGTLSSDPDGTIATYAWSQTAGTPTVVITNASSAQPTFPAPTVAVATTLTFSLTVTDNQGASSTPATVTITVNPAPAGTVAVSGTIRFQRVPVTANGLDHSSQTMQPARGIVVRALDAGNNAVLATGITNDSGGYSLSVAPNTSIRIQAAAQMLREAPQALPRWNFSVMDYLDDADVPKPGAVVYVFTDAAFNSSTAGAHDVAIPSGYNNSGTVTGTRASGPFAVLDTVYRATQTVLSVDADADFPLLIMDWAEDNPGGQTYFNSSTGNGTGPAAITLAADPSEDTDEFDAHVIAHEFGHYLEHSFSRADSIGGPHARGDKIDIRVAFGEGFGYAFSAIVLNDPVARDTFVEANAQVSSTFNVETNPPASSVGTQDYGCFCSESSVWSILWDIYDPVADANDTLSLGLAPIWSVLTTDQRTTPAFTSIFSFIAALKEARPANATAINTLVSAQNISVVTDAFATGESNSPASVPSSAVLPLYTTATIGGPPVTLFSSGAAGTYNALGNRRYIRFNVATTRNVTITASSSNPTGDTDFVVYRNGEIVTFGIDFPPDPEVTTFNFSPGTYIIDVYDCANGCGDPDTAGDYNLTVTLN